MANGEVIKQVREQLQNPKGLSAKNAQLMTLTLLADLYEKWEADHKILEDTESRLSKAEQAVSLGKWILGSVGVANIGVLVGILTHTIHL